MTPGETRVMQYAGEMYKTPRGTEALGDIVYKPEGVPNATIDHVLTTYNGSLPDPVRQLLLNQNGDMEGTERLGFVVREMAKKMGFKESAVALEVASVLTHGSN